MVVVLLVAATRVYILIEMFDFPRVGLQNFLQALHFGTPRDPQREQLQIVVVGSSF